MQILLTDFISKAIESGTEQLYFSVGRPVSYKDSTGGLMPLDDKAVILTSENMKALIDQAVKEQKDKETLRDYGEVETILSAHGKMRSRVNAYLQRGTYTMTVTILTMDLEPIIPVENWKLGLKPILVKPAGGLCVITGHQDISKLTASLVDYYNSNYSCYIITLEDNVSTLHRHKKAIVTQRELPSQDMGETVSRLKNIGVDVCVLVSDKNEKLFSEITQIAMSGVFVIAAFNKSSLDVLGRSLSAGMEPHEIEEFKERLKKCLRLCIDMDNNAVSAELPL